MVNRKPPLFSAETMTKEEEKKRKRIGEVVGGTAAECAMVCCCFPCAVIHFVVLAVYKVPAGICRRMWRKKKRKRLLRKRKTDEDLWEKNEISEKDDGDGEDDDDDDVAVETVEFETEMWDRFYGAGFWRSPSQREDEED